MKFTARLTFVLLATLIGVPAALAWSAQIGQKVWSPRVFAWRNFLKEQPIIRDQQDSPLRIVNARFYSFASLISSVGSVLKFDLKNVSGKSIHSFTISYRSPDPLDTGSIGVQPEEILQPGQSGDAGISARGKDRITLMVDFVQFSDGSTWYSDPPNHTVKPEGVQAGARAAHNHLLGVLQSKGASAVMDTLPRIHADVKEADFFGTREVYGYHGFYNGVTNTKVRVEHAYQQGGLSKVVAFLKHQ